MGTEDLGYLVIVCKSEAISSVWKKGAAQLSYSMNWFTSKCDSSCTVTPVLVHRSGSMLRTRVLISGR